MRNGLTSRHSPQRCSIPSPILPNRPTHLKAPHHRSDLVTDGISKPPVDGIPPLGRDDVAGELTCVQGLRGGLQSRLAEREQVGPLHRLCGAVVGRGGPSLGCGGILETDHRDDVEKVGASLRQPGVQTVDLGFDLRSLEQELGDDEGVGHARHCRNPRRPQLGVSFGACYLIPHCSTDRGRDGRPTAPRGRGGSAGSCCAAAACAGAACPARSASAPRPRPTSGRRRGAARRARAAGRIARTGPRRGETGSTGTARASRSGRASGGGGGSARDGLGEGDSRGYAGGLASSSAGRSHGCRNTRRPIQHRLTPLYAPALTDSPDDRRGAL